MTTAPGKFIVLEGIDGSGTTTQAKVLAAELAARGHLVCLTCEPTTGPVGVLIRQALQRRFVVPSIGGPRAPDWRTMALLFAADRLDHNDALILPALARGEVVISDRYYLSSLLYQSLTAAAVEDPLPWLRAINSRAVSPDLTLVFDVDAEVAARRRQGRGGPAELFEIDELQSRLAAAYAAAERAIPADRVVHLDAGRAVSEVSRSVVEAALGLF